MREGNCRQMGASASSWEVGFAEPWSSKACQAPSATCVGLRGTVALFNIKGAAERPMCAAGAAHHDPGGDRPRTPRLVAIDDKAFAARPHSAHCTPASAAAGDRLRKRLMGTKPCGDGHLRSINQNQATPAGSPLNCNAFSKLPYLDLSTAHSRNRRYAWLAALVMLLGALVPTMGRALAMGLRGQAWVEVCTSSGTRWVAAGGADTKEYSASSQGRTSIPRAAACCMRITAPVAAPTPAARASPPSAFRRRYCRWPRKGFRHFSSLLRERFSRGPLRNPARHLCSADPLKLVSSGTRSTCASTFRTPDVAYVR